MKTFYLKCKSIIFGGILDESNEILINSIKKNLKAESIKLLVKTLYDPISNESVLKFISFLKKNYDGKNSISVTDPECRWMPDKKRKNRVELQLSESHR